MGTKDTLKPGDPKPSARLHCLADDLWVAERPQTYFGLSIGTRMTVIRQRNTNKLLLLSPIQPTDELEKGLAELRQKCPHLELDHLLSADAPSPWPDLLLCSLTGLRTLGPTGPSPLHEVSFCHMPSRTLILTDSAFHFDASASCSPAG